MLGFPNKEGGRSSDSGLFHFVGGLFDSGLISGFIVRQNSPLGMSVLVGGQVGVHDDLLLRDSSNGDCYPVFNPDQTPLEVSVDAASAVNDRIDALVIYIDLNEPATQTIADNTNMVNAIAVAGTPAGSPTAPDSTTIQAAVGAGNPYFVVATYTVPATTTTITDSMITNTPYTVVAKNLCRFHAYRNAAWTGNSGKINLDAVVFDLSSNFDSTTNYRYNVPVTGYYDIHFAVSSQQANGTGYGAYVRKNGTTLVIAGSRIISTQTTSFNIITNGSGHIYLEAGDYLELMYFGGGSVAGTTGSAYTYMSGCLAAID